MAFILPEDKSTFTAANGITYAWKDDHWVVQKFKGDSEVFVDSQPPNNPEQGKLWYDNSGDVLSCLFTLKANGSQLLQTVSLRWNHVLRLTSRASVICGLTKLVKTLLLPVTPALRLRRRRWPIPVCHPDS